MKFLIFFLFGVCMINGEAVNYNGYKVYRITPSNDEQNEMLSKLQSNVRSLDFWRSPNRPGIPVDVMVSPSQQEAFINSFQDYDMEVQTLINNVQELVELGRNSEERLAKFDMSWTDYHSLEDIHAWLDSLAKNFPEVKVLSIGKSYEGRDLKGVKISFGPGRRGVFIDGGIHAREWISTACVTYIINELLNGTDPVFTRIAKSFDWYLFPNINPDGYTYSRTTDRMWRKTRTPNGKCYGADPNRNFDFYWGQIGISQDPCSDIYPGTKVFSEIEVENLANFITEISSTLDVYLTFHSYSQLLLLPFANTTDHLSNYNDTKQIGLKTIEALSKKYGTQYNVGNSAEILYTSSGTSRDWIKNTFNIPIVYTYELRDKGIYGFLLPPSQIIPNNEEVIDSLVGLFSEAERLEYFVLLNE